MLSNDWPQLLRLLWREQHPGAYEQGRLDFAATAGTVEPKARDLFAGMGDLSIASGRPWSDGQRQISLPQPHNRKLLRAFATRVCKEAAICRGIGKLASVQHGNGIRNMEGHGQRGPRPRRCRLGAMHDQHGKCLGLSETATA